MTVQDGGGNPVVMITGAGGGIGSAAAQRFADAGASLVLLDLDRNGLDVTLGKLETTARARALAIALDITDEAALDEAMRVTLDRHGRLDVGVNNAGIEEEHRPLAEGDEALFDRLFRVNVKGTWLCMRHQLRQMKSQQGGSIVNVASVAGLAAAPGQAIYAATKHAVVGLTRSAAAEYARHGVRINCVCPGITDTPMLARAIERNPKRAALVERAQPMPRAARPEEIAEAIFWLAGPAASYVTGHPLAVDGGMMAT